jgi:hypothetical protein
MFAVLKDTQEHGRDLDTVLSTYTELVKPAFEEFCLPVCSGNKFFHLKFVRSLQPGISIMFRSLLWFK